MTQRPIYLDVCALCRPFDDQSFVRIRLESDAVRLILQHVRAGELRLVYSPVHQREIAAITEIFERMELLAILSSVGHPVTLLDAKATRTRAEYLVQRGFGIADAAHVSFAEAALSDFVTCDDRLLRKCRLVQSTVWCGTPIEFCGKEDLR
ncbi:PIN domain-containing protein [Chrysiogenes arsenatis]|uniref:PIN domain-containing protein n=1 Tax=Chrysiogenes arsenatis TaxID=309797 RepID=UPI000483A5DE|nr:PIN domain-containing protein [Chrysiogenes arsenatis]